MTSIRPSMPGIPQTGPIQNVQKAPAPPKTEETKAPPPKQETAAPPKDENKTKTFDDTPMEDVSMKFEGESKAAEATAEIEGLFDAEAPEETDEAGKVEESDEPEEGGEVEEGSEAEEAHEIEVEEEDEEEEADPDYDQESEAGGEGPEAEHHINVAPLLELVAQLRELPRFRIEETWQVYGG